ncbi:SDR family NAD(P)-dependent oxidoreductase [Marinifilum caeruleilacunae]|uniref:SDR family oxidoreductase n=1 Tax=Marinifilum caeruleilacunae TaxID=2499076 RepID=A0ABX1WQC7_9BACT|nr:SDR family oxidoreductase [Marinifilum caeruleilacunae]NOU58284.1 SDR family oxidoreductase [Marinifilum caeruleilacunae]
MKRNILITGGSAGMGLSTAIKFAENGDQVIITGRNREKLEEVKQKYPNIYTIASDVSISEERKALMIEIQKKFGHIDILFSNVGVGIFKPLTEISEDEFDKLVNVNYKGTFFFIQEALKIMPDNSRIIVNSSWTHHRGLYSSALYGSTKAAISHLVKSLSIELADRGININAISPGYINTEQFNEEMLGEKAAQARKLQVPVKRFGKPEEISGMVYFLASSDASYINGQDILIDGGLTAVHNY